MNKLVEIVNFKNYNMNPKDVYGRLLPEEYFPSYHLINVGMEYGEEARLNNPLRSIVQKFSEDDLIIVKMDIDTAATELPLVQQLLDDKDGIWQAYRPNLL